MTWHRLHGVILGRHPPLQYMRRAVAPPAPSSHDAPMRQLSSLSHVSQRISLNPSTLRPAREGDSSSMSPVLQRLRPLHVSVHCDTNAPAASRPASKVHQRGPQADFQAQLDDGTLRLDPRQVAAIGLLQDVYTELEKLYPRKKKPSNLTMLNSVSTKENYAAWWSTLMRVTDPPPGQGPQVDTHRAKGLYMWGGVGVGKTMLMDIFVRSAPKEFKVRRIHFHDLMIEVHSRLREFSGEQDPLRKVADKIAAHNRVLCLDELFVTDVADAVILERLFGRLWHQGLTVIATSNRHPRSLYEGGLQRQLFVPFIHRLERECVVHDMDSVTDYRRLATSTVGLYFVRLVEGRSNDDRLAHALAPITEGWKQEATSVPVAMGRELQVPCAWGNGVCWFKFEELFGAAVGAPDFIALVSKFHTIALQGVPIFTGENRSMGYRFVTFMDIAYEHRTKVLMSAEGYPNDLFKQVMTLYDSKQSGQVSDDVVVDDNLGFAKDRTISRLIEMQTIEYALAHSERNQPEMKLALEEAKSKLEN